MPLSGHGRAGCCPVFTGCRYSLIQDRIVCKTNYDNQVGSAHHVRIKSFGTVYCFPGWKAFRIPVLIHRTIAEDEKPVIC